MTLKVWLYILFCFDHIQWSLPNALISFYVLIKYSIEDRSFKSYWYIIDIPIPEQTWFLQCWSQQSLQGICYDDLICPSNFALFCHNLCMKFLQLCDVLILFTPSPSFILWIYSGCVTHCIDACFEGNNIFLMAYDPWSMNYVM